MNDSHLSIPTIVRPKSHQVPKTRIQVRISVSQLLRNLHLRNRPSVSLPAIDRDQIKVNYVNYNEKRLRSKVGSPFCVPECRPSKKQSIPCPNPCR